jgi:hypothetical protein
MKIWTLLLAGFAFGSAVVAADGDLWSKTINNDSNGIWYFQPDKPKARVIKVATLKGGQAYHIKARKGANPWDVQANSPVQGAINQGDTIMLMYFARAAEPAEGGSSLTARIQATAAPWTATMDMTSKITSEWQSYCAHRVASATLEKSSVSIHLAGADQVIELGPVFVFNLGKGYPENQLKGCDG